jgi:carbon-monoxide dehydrogenase large subunit
MSDASSVAGSSAGRFGSGRAVKRVEDAALLAGHGQFVDNVAVDGQCHVAFQRSPHAHARIVAIS